MDVVALVQAAMQAGASTRKEIALAAGLDRDVVDAILDVLVRTNSIEVHSLKFECGAGGCGNCVQDAACVPGPVPLQLRAKP